MGYHLKKINKGVLGEHSKIVEEWEEFEDAKEQGSKIMMMVELCDVFGAIRAFHNKYLGCPEPIIVVSQELSRLDRERVALGLEREDLIAFADITERAFKDGARG